MIALILGGTRSGKSELAERRAAQLTQPVVYVATAIPSDEAMRRRIARHRASRPAGWSTVEVAGGADLAAELVGIHGSVLVDSLGTWLASQQDFAFDAASLCEALAERRGDTVVVSEEVGLGVHPVTEAGREFADQLGRLNQEVAHVADEAVLVVAGRPVRLGNPQWPGEL